MDVDATEEAETPTLDRLREEASYLREAITVRVAQASPPVVQELVLAQRAVEECRMRLGVAEAYEKGLDPWANKVK